MVNKNLRIISFNVGSLVDRSRVAELQYFLEKYKVDIALIQETHLSSEISMYIQNFVVHRYDDGQGVAIMIRSSLHHDLVCSPDLSIPSIFVKLKFFQNLVIKENLVGCVYFPSNLPVLECSRILDNIDNFSSRFYGSIFGGDLNAKNISWGDLTNNLNGNSLLNWLHNSQFSSTRL